MPLIGIQVTGEDASSVIDAIVEAERVGFHAAWLTSGWIAPDPLPILAVAARETERILLGTSIVPMLTRHPLALVQAAVVVQELSHGRFRLGVGTTTKGVAERILGVPWPRHPLAALREYVSIVRGALETGRADVSGEWYSGHGRISTPAPMPVLVAALGERAWANAGVCADGGISWMGPRAYLSRIARPALDRGASEGGRTRPSLVAHVPAALSSDDAAIAGAMSRQLGAYARVAEYRAMFAAAGAPIGADGTYSRDLLADLVLTQRELQQGPTAVLESFEKAGIDELLLSPLDTGLGGRETSRQLARLLFA